MKTKILLIVLVAWGLGALSRAFVAEAATLFIAPPSSEVGMGEKLTVDLKTDSEGVSLNAAQAVLRFPKDILEVVSVDKTGSIFSFWLEEPNFSNTDGAISFVGGTPYGASGSSIQILRVIFTAKGSGAGTLSASDAAITASDGSGTNILSKVHDAAIAVIPERVTPKTPEAERKPPEAPAVQQKIPEPEQIVRKPVPSGKLPLKPTLKIPLYPEENRWYNLVAQFTVRWDVPLDISGVSTALNKYPNSIPPERSEGLFDNKTFASLSDGVWYLHIRFRNDVGWGPTAHHRLAIDTEPPLGFELSIVEGEATDNPAPTLQFRTSDALSGLKEYQIRVGDGAVLKIPAAEFDGSFTLPLQTPGTRHISVRAVDEADNGIEDSVTLQTIPIASPTITFVTKELFSDEEKGLTVKGTALPAINVLLRVYRKEALVAEGTARTDEKGNWEFTIDQAFKNGSYTATAQSKDARGALSLIVDSAPIKVKSKPIIQIGFLELGKGGAAVLLLFILIAGFGGGIWFYKRRQEKISLRVLLVESEVTKIFTLIMDDVERLSKASETPTSADDAYALKQLQENVKRMEAYLKKGLEKIKK
ncbi:MAG: Ig-like domain-containing protein [bacterium]|nr:Ig-like domain-containing protein [bacterium]